MWEYHNEIIASPGQLPKSHAARMKQLGDDGWELCGVGNLVSSGYRMFFKRPKRSEDPYR